MRKIFHALAAAIMAAVLSATCLGATTAQAADYNKTVTFSGVNDGDTINVYELGKYEGNSYNSFKFDDNFAAFLSEPERADCDASNQKKLMEYLQALNNNQDGLRELVSAYVNGWGSNYAAPATSTTLQKSAGTEPQSVFGPGYYLVLPATTGANSSLYNPVVFSISVSGDKSLISFNGQAGIEGAAATVNMKTVDGPQIEKYVLRADTYTLRKTKTVGIGDEVTYVVKLTLPDYSTAFDPDLVLVDKLTNLKYVSGSIAVYDSFTSGQPLSADHLIANAVNVDKVSEGTYENATQSVSFSLDYNNIRGGSAGPKTVYVTYRATVMDDIVVTPKDNGQFVGSNVVFLDYRTSAMNDVRAQTASCVAKVFTYEFRLEKLDGSGNALNGATFQLFSKKGDGAEQQLKFKQTTDGYYVVADDADRNAIDAIPANSSFAVRGLDSFNTYYVKESQTPNGYYAPAGRFAVNMKSAMDSGDVNEHSGNLSDHESAVVAENSQNQGTDGALVDKSVEKATFTMRLRNSTMPVLPSTGGMGTALFTIGGVALMAVAVVAFVVIRRKGEQK